MRVHHSYITIETSKPKERGRIQYESSFPAKLCFSIYPFAKIYHSPFEGNDSKASTKEEDLLLGIYLSINSLVKL